MDPNTALENLLYVYAQRRQMGGKRFLSHAGQPVLKDAFETLGWEDMHECERGGCMHPGCPLWATCYVREPQGNTVGSYCSNHVG